MVPMKVAHIIKSLNPGGVETWLKDLSYSSTDDLHFLLHNSTESYYEKDVIKNGVTINRVPLSKNFFKFSYELYRLIKREKFDIVHSHVNLTSGWFLFLSLLAGVKIRVAHCHNDKRPEYSRASIKRKIYNHIMKLFVHVFSNRKIAVSKSCLMSMFYSRFADVAILPCGLNFKQNKKKYNKANFGFKESDIVLLHVGRFVPQKNHIFILDIMMKLKPYEDIKLLLIGEGKGMEYCLNIKNSNNLDNVFFLGVNSYVQDIMHSVIDFLILPSKFEGLGLVAIESQSCNVHTMVSDCVPIDVKISDYIDFLPIKSSDVWAEKIILNISEKKHIQSKSKSFDNSQFTIDENTKLLSSIYLNTY